jgi:radical SAM family uncharacterized protein
MTKRESITLREKVEQLLLPDIQTPGQYIGGELNSTPPEEGGGEKNAFPLNGRVCLAFPDKYSIGMSHHGLQVLYAAMNRHEGWRCERVFSPGCDFEDSLRNAGLPLYSLESFLPLSDFDVLGFTLQYDLCYTNVLTMIDLGGIPIHSSDRELDAPLVIAGGPCAFTPEPMADFIDLFVIGDGEESLPAVCDAWIEARKTSDTRSEALTKLAELLPFAYVPSLYDPTTFVPENDSVPQQVEPAVVADLDATPLPILPVVPNVEAVQDRIAIEIMRGCPGRCRFCQSTSIKRPIRYRSVDTIIEAALETHRNTGYNEISLLSLSTSDYRELEPLMRRMQETFRPLGVAISVPSLRVTDQLGVMTELLNTDRRSGLTLAPEAALDDMRQKIGKRVRNEDLFEGCRVAFERGFDRVKLYFMCGLPDERQEDLDGIIEMSEKIARIGKEVCGRFPTVTANVSNFVPKPHTPFQWLGMSDWDYFANAHRYLRNRPRLRCVKVKHHDLETSLLEGLMCRGDRSLGRLIETVWREGARFDAWSEHFEARRWNDAIQKLGIDVEGIVHSPRDPEALTSWSHIGIPIGCESLRREYDDSLLVVLGGSEETSEA